MTHRLTFGLPRMCQERGERRDFLPDLVHTLAARGCPVVVEDGIGARIGHRTEDYLHATGLVRVGTTADAYAQDVVVVLRAEEDRFASMRPGALLVSMLHFQTRPARVRRLLDLGIDALSLDSIIDDEGRRLVENMRAVGWNGLDAAFDALMQTRDVNPDADPVQVTILGAGTVGKHAIEAATKFGSPRRQAAMTAVGATGVHVTVVGRNATPHLGPMRHLLNRSDILVDASQRSDPSRPLVPNDLLADLPAHAVICDLVVDPYLLDGKPPIVRGIEGIPAGDLDQWTFAPTDPRWQATIPPGIPTRCRRTVVSCRAWPGITPAECMHHYGRQLAPLLATLVERGGVPGIAAAQTRYERALSRATLLAWVNRATEARSPVSASD